MTSRPDPVETALDLLVYAPLGLALEVRDRALVLAQRGRERVAGQEPAARLIGQIVVSQGRKRAEQALKLLRQPPGGPRPGPAEEPAGRGRSSFSDGRAEEGPGPVARAAPAPPGTAASAGAGPDASTLAIPGYDTLSASQVVPRLEGLSADDLEAVRAYEEATRVRKTVLTRIGQLRGR